MSKITIQILEDIRRGERTLVCAGSGIGKSRYFAEVAKNVDELALAGVAASITPPPPSDLVWWNGWRWIAEEELKMKGGRK